MRAHYLQHVPFEGLGSIESWLQAAGYEITNTRFFESVSLPDVNEVDLLIAMGGPMSVNDEGEFPWLAPEKQFIRDAIRLGKSVLGVCLGAQLIASALGARIYPNPRKEIGWFPIEAIRNPPGVFSFPEKCTVFHWHGETFDLPTGAKRLARSVACENQAFQIGQNVIGLQFHLETTPEAADLIIRNCRSELVDGTHIQTEQAMHAVPEAAYAAINKLVSEVLSYVTRP